MKTKITKLLGFILFLIAIILIAIPIWFALVFEDVCLSDCIVVSSLQENIDKPDQSINLSTAISNPTLGDDIKNPDENLYQILQIFDGDTYRVLIDGKKEKVRVLGIDTPEVGGGYRTEDCFGDDASKYVKEILAGKKIGLLKPESHENRDKYDRLLRYVFFEGKDFGAHLIEEGYAQAYRKFPHPRRSYYFQLEKESKKNKKGMWNPENCSYWGQEG